jgi:hypothetical protein
LKYTFMGWSMKAWDSCQIMNINTITEETYMHIHTHYIRDIVLIYNIYV